MACFCTNFACHVAASTCIIVRQWSIHDTKSLCPRYYYYTRGDPKIILQYIQGDPLVAGWLTHWLTGSLAHWLTDWVSSGTTEPIAMIFGMWTTFWSGKWLHVLFFKNLKNWQPCTQFFNFQLYFLFMARFCSNFQWTKFDALWHKNYIFVWEVTPRIIFQKFQKLATLHTYI